MSSQFQQCFCAEFVHCRKQIIPLLPFNGCRKTFFPHSLHFAILWEILIKYKNAKYLACVCVCVCLTVAGNRKQSNCGLCRCCTEFMYFRRDLSVPTSVLTQLHIKGKASNFNTMLIRSGLGQAVSFVQLNWKKTKTKQKKTHQEIGL